MAELPRMLTIRTAGRVHFVAMTGPRRAVMRPDSDMMCCFETRYCNARCAAFRVEPSLRDRVALCIRIGLDHRHSIGYLVEDDVVVEREGAGE